MALTLRPLPAPNQPARSMLRMWKVIEDLEEHYYSHLRRYSATLERDRPRHYTPQQLNAQEWDFHGGHLCRS